MQGVRLAHLKYPNGNFRAQIMLDGKTKSLGSYATLEQARFAYKTAKETEARRWFQRLTDKEFIVDPRVIERMQVWQLA